MKFLRDDDEGNQSFDAERFAKVVELVITAMDISICFADFPTQKIGETTRAFRQLGIGYANLGALLMATGHAYDSDGGRALAGAITSLMTGTVLPALRRAGRGRRPVRRLRPQRRRRTSASCSSTPTPTPPPSGWTTWTRRSGPRPPRPGRTCCGSARKNGFRNAQASRSRADRHHRPDDGLRHHRRRARPRPGQVQEAGRRRLDADRQQHRAAGAAAARLPAGAGRGDRRAHRRARQRRRRPRPQARALRGLRLRDGRAGDLRRWATSG